MDVPEENLWNYFDYETIINNLTEKLVGVSSINPKYLNVEAMRADLYDELVEFIFNSGYYDFDDLINDPEVETSLSNNSELEDFSRNTIYPLILGIKEEEIGNKYEGTELSYNEDRAMQKGEAIQLIIIGSFLELINEYRELLKDKNKRRL